MRTSATEQLATAHLSQAMYVSMYYHHICLRDSTSTYMSDFSNLKFLASAPMTIMQTSHHASKSAAMSDKNTPQASNKTQRSEHEDMSKNAHHAAAVTPDCGN